MNTLLRHLTACISLFAASNSHASNYYVNHGSHEGSRYFWEHGKTVGSKYYWENGKGPGSEYFWHHGDGAASRYAWRHSRSTSSLYHYQHSTEQYSQYYWLHSVDKGSKYFWQNAKEPSLDPVYIAVCLEGKLDTEMCSVVTASFNHNNQNHFEISRPDFHHGISEIDTQVFHLNRQIKGIQSADVKPIK